MNVQARSVQFEICFYLQIPGKLKKYRLQFKMKILSLRDQKIVKN